MSGTLGTIAGEFLQCSFRGVPFVVRGSGGTHGRKQAPHDYPGRDGIMIEDLGRQARRIRISGFVVGAFAYAQRDLLIQATETAGTGLLVHATRGIMQVWCSRFEWREPEERTRVVELEFEFIEESSLLPTLVTAALSASVGALVTALNTSSASSYASRTSSALDYGASVLSAAQTVASSWAAGALFAVESPMMQQSAMSVLDGNYGRYASGSSSDVDTTATVASQLAALATDRASVSSAIASVATSDSAATLATAVQAVITALADATDDPGVLISLLWPLTSCAPSITASSAPIGGAIATVQTETAAHCRRAALAAIGSACASWSPSSSNEAQDMASRVTSLIEAEETTAGDAGDDADYEALHELRAQVAEDLQKRAVQLADIVTIQRNANLPALLLAQQLYGDGTRSDDLVQRADPIHPAFMPNEFEALSA
ncbi:bacteriophage protein [Acetobacter nitrogenifigens DSM 23921 = NBRC 105050]|uniref:DNA circulation N-terminal domain-containing protein n=1 Tax=Acetobacter nitrogenifigens DSM 23921 = NBRC 105050 TaxID=1120919 RepID=A0A511X5C5_9PROT|nr:DNA circularization N-terminal domain-containing protein [Acetobacter nitrogenifigens]GBQ92078.1 bacteriophage protein [Acetobacter nitrogenifigens DSM 23921 = NBRC 105050]GEN58133.1 hypothetical protein ANI02nite_00170 [Acetobacter nitrogenifigens DSM 23921 = NBRC 105050]